MFKRIPHAAVIAVAIVILGACSSGSMNSAAPPVTDRNAAAWAAAGSQSILNTLTNEETIGSTSPSTPHDVNPYGLDVAKVTAGKIDAGDLVVCDFNNPGNVQGTGTEIVTLHPHPGASPQLFVKDNTLMGCDALVTAPTGNVWAAAFKANDNPNFQSSGTLLTAFKNGPWDHPFGEAFAPPLIENSSQCQHGRLGYCPAFYVSNAGNGSLVRVTVISSASSIQPCTLATCTFTFTVIATNFPVNHGKPGSILGPSGLNYQRYGDRLYVVDGTNNTLYAIDNVSRIGAGGITVNGSSFSGPQAANAHVIFSGAPLNGPISSALLFNGNIVLANTLDPDGTNLMVEISPMGHVLGVKNVDTGAAGALFGMVATGTSGASTKLYFNDDNDNTVKVLSAGP